MARKQKQNTAVDSKKAIVPAPKLPVKASEAGKLAVKLANALNASSKPAEAPKPKPAVVPVNTPDTKALDAAATVSTRPASLIPSMLSIGMLVMAVYSRQRGTQAGTYVARVLDVTADIVTVEYFSYFANTTKPHYEKNTLVFYADTQSFRDATVSGSPLRLAPYDATHKQAAEFTAIEALLTDSGKRSALLGAVILANSPPAATATATATN